METIGDAKDVAIFRPLAIAISPKQGVVLTNHDSLSSATHSRSEMPLCPAYRFCKKSKGPYRPPMLDSDHDQQITTLHDLLQAIKEAALRLIQLITSDIEIRRRKDPRIRYPDPRYEGAKQSLSPGSGLIATTSSSVCALCGVALHQKDSSSKSRQFERIDDYSNDILSKHLDEMFLKMADKVPPAEKDKISDNFPIHGRVDYILSKENNSVDIRARGQEKSSSKTQSTDTSDSGLQSKLLFVRRVPSDTTACQISQGRKYESANQMPRYIGENSESSHRCVINVSTISSTQDASTLTQELCPCACGLLTRDGIKSKVSVNPTSVLKDKLIKTKFEKTSKDLDAKEMAQAKLHDDTLKVKKTKTPKKRDPNVKHWIEEIVQLRLQMQIEELHKNIQFFKQENEYIRRLAEKCRCLSEDVRGMQQLLSIKDMHSELTTIQHLQAKYHNEHGIIATLTGMFRGSMNIQQIAAKLLTPFLERWNPRDNIVAADVSSAPGAPQVPSNPPSSVVLDVY